MRVEGKNNVVNTSTLCGAWSEVFSSSRIHAGWFWPAVFRLSKLQNCADPSVQLRAGFHWASRTSLQPNRTTRLKTSFYPAERVLTITVTGVTIIASFGVWESSLESVWSSREELTCYTILTLLSTLSEQILWTLDVEALTDELQFRAKSRNSVQSPPSSSKWLQQSRGDQISTSPLTLTSQYISRWSHFVETLPIFGRTNSQFINVSL